MSVENPNFEDEPQPEQKSEKPETDWSYVDGILKEKEEERRAKLSPEELAEDDKKKQQVAKTLRFFDNQKKLENGTQEEKRQAKKDLEAGRKATEKLVDEAIETIDEQTQRDVEVIKQQAYEEIKARTEKFRQEHGIEISEAELKKEDRELKRRLGLK